MLGVGFSLSLLVFCLFLSISSVSLTLCFLSRAFFHFLCSVTFLFFLTFQFFFSPDHFYFRTRTVGCWFLNSFVFSFSSCFLFVFLSLYALPFLPFFLCLLFFSFLFLTLCFLSSFCHFLLLFLTFQFFFSANHFYFRARTVSCWFLNSLGFLLRCIDLNRNWFS